MTGLAKQKAPDMPEENIETTASAEEDQANPERALADQLEQALNVEKEKYLRLAAEYDNYRKRSIKEREGIYNELRSDTITRFLPIYDNLARALSLECADEPFYKGVEMIMSQLKEIMDKLGVKAIEAVGKPFDPDRHNAVMHVEDPEYGDGIVVEEFEKGFTLGDKVIRFSMVKVAN